MTPKHIKTVAVTMAAEKGLQNLSRSTLCARAQVPPGSFAHIMGKSFKAFIRELADEGHGGAVVEVTKTRIDPALRRNHIVATAARLAEEHGLNGYTRDQVAGAAKVSASTVSAYFNTMPQLRRAVLRHARKQGNDSILKQIGG